MKAKPPTQALERVQAWRAARLQLNWWTQSQPIRTIAEMPITFSLLNTRSPFIYQQVAEKARELWRLGMPACAIARMLKTSDKTVSKALRYHESGGSKGS